MLLTSVVCGGSVGFAQQSPEQVEESSDPARVYTLDDLLARAKDKTNFVEEYRHKLKKAQWQKYRADWGWFPKVESKTYVAPVPARADPSNVDRNFNEIAALNIGPFVKQDLTVVVPVYTFGRISNAQKLAEVGIDNQKIKKERALLDRFYQVKRAFYSLQFSEKAESLLKEGDRRLEQKVKQMQEARDFGTADFETSDLRKLQIFSAEVDSRRLDNQRLDKVAQKGLRFLTGLPEGDVGVPNMDTDSEPDALRKEDYYVDKAMEYRPQLAQLNRAVRARSLQVDLAKSKMYPTIFAAGGAGFGWSTKEPARRHVCRLENGSCDPVDEPLYVEPFSNPLDRLSFKIGLGMRWRFDFPQHYGKLQEKKAQYDTILAQRRRARGAVELDVQRLYAKAKDALKKIEVQKRKLDAAEAWRDQYGLAIESGGASVKDAVKPLKAHYKAQADYYKARYEYRMARAALVKAVGLRRLGDTGRVVETERQFGLNGSAKQVR